MVVSFERANKNVESKRRLVKDLQEFLQIPSDDVQENTAVKRMCE